ncbi:MAG: ribonuclease HII [Capsulimonadales bacterium]|nr:ribonuclease HII [Capsulimonadales bacterium]
MKIAGVDEVGRGPLAGPVVAAAVILPEDCEIPGMTDSKRMTPAARERVFARLCELDVAIGIGMVEADEIDRINILQATYKAMRLAVAALPIPPDEVLVDGLPVPNLYRVCRNLVRGDALCPAISAASVVAKVTRDRLMTGRYQKEFPLYQFARHKGYGTPEHLEALREHGPCILHRRSFAPVAQCVLRFEESV